MCAVLFVSCSVNWLRYKKLLQTDRALAAVARQRAATISTNEHVIISHRFTAYEVTTSRRDRNIYYYYFARGSGGKVL